VSHAVRSGIQTAARKPSSRLSFIVDDVDVHAQRNQSFDLMRSSHSACGGGHPHRLAAGRPGLRISALGQKVIEDLIGVVIGRNIGAVPLASVAFTEGFS
jgi:hypothetical protein